MICRHAAQKISRHVETVDYNYDDVPGYYGYWKGTICLPKTENTPRWTLYWSLWCWCILRWFKHVCVRECMYVHVCAGMCMCVHACVHVCVYARVCVCACVYMCVCACVCAYAHFCVCVRACVCEMCVCVHSTHFKTQKWCSLLMRAFGWKNVKVCTRVCIYWWTSFLAKKCWMQTLDTCLL